METMIVRKNWWIAVFVLLLAAFLAVPFSSARAAEGDGTFKVTVNHGINGKSLSNELPKALPVDVVIWKDGAVKEARVVASAPNADRLKDAMAKKGTPEAILGDPRLAAAALDAVREWRYEPVRKDGQPVEAKLTITVNFRLS